MKTNGSKREDMYLKVRLITDDASYEYKCLNVWFQQGYTRDLHWKSQQR